MAAKTIGIILNGATGRICSTQHIANALVPIRDEGGLPTGDDHIVPRLKLVGRNTDKLADLAKKYGAEWTTSLDEALADPAFTIFFDAAATSQRHDALEKALAAGGPIRRVVTAMTTATPSRIDEQGSRYDVDVEDTASTLVELESGAIGTIQSSWATRLRRDDLLTFQIDGTKGSALAGLHKCWTATDAQTPRTAHFSVATDLNVDYRANWHEVVNSGPFKNPYRIGWENFLRHLATGAPMTADFAAGIRDVQFAEACYRSIKEETWIRLAAL